MPTAKLIEKFLSFKLRSSGILKELFNINERGNVIIVFVAILLLIIVSLFLVFGQKIFLTDKKVEKSPAVSPNTTTSQNLNPNTGDLYQDIKIRMREVLK